MRDPLIEPVAAPDAALATAEAEAPRRTFKLEDTGFKEVPKRFRLFYRRWKGAGDVLGPNEALCPVCKVVIRSMRELRVGDRLYCMPCMSRLVVVEQDGQLLATVAYG